MWNDCTVAHKDGKFIIDKDKDLTFAFLIYRNSINKNPSLPVWYDTKAKVCFGAEQDFYCNPQEFSFYSQKKDFASNPRWGLEHVKQYFFSTLGNNLSVTDDYMIHNFEKLKEKYEGKDILLIGGGPSTVETDWQEKSFNFDYVWSCNMFFKNSIFNKLKVDLSAIGPTVNLFDEELIQYTKDNKMSIALEAGISPFRSQEELKKIKSLFPEQVEYFHTRYFSKLGTLPRMLCWASFFKVKNIYVVGMDGYPGKTGNKYIHAFEGNKTDHGGRIFSYDLHRRQYAMLWDYLLNMIEGSVTTFHNLGEGHPGNQTTDISKKEFPLKI